MSDYCMNYMIVTHEEKSKIKFLYQISDTEDFFHKILPPPDDKCSFEDKYSWSIKNWGTFSPPMYDSADERKLSENGTIFTFRFDTKIGPPIGIYQELECQGYRVKAYYVEPFGFCFCGSFIYGIHEHIEYLEEGNDIPPDIDWCFGVEGFKKLLEPKPIEKKDVQMTPELSNNKNNKEDIAEKHERPINQEVDLEYFLNIVD